jgi:phosphoadenosine phosphosulfate reductase
MTLREVGPASDAADPGGASPSGSKGVALRQRDDNVVVLSSRLAEVRAHALLADVIRQEFAGRVALVSSFGAESAILLHLVSRIDRAMPVIFIDTGRLFAQTHAYRDMLAARLGLTDIRRAGPDATLLSGEDADRSLWRRDPDRCCAIRKVAPLAKALEGFDAWITGRKRFHGGDRSGLALVEADDRRVKLNPLADWSHSDIEAYLRRHSLPRHPLVAEGFLSIGCEPCTDRTFSDAAAGDNPRQGRWRGRDKSECGIHLGIERHGLKASGM